MKKVLALALSTAMLVALAAGCGEKTTTPAGSDAKGAQTGEGQGQAQINPEDIPDASAPDDVLKAVPQAEILAKVPKTEPHGTVTVGDITEPDSNVLGGFTNPSSNQMMRYLISGLETFTTSRDNQGVRNNVVLKDYSRTENPDGTVTVKQTIYDNLKFSDGSPIEAKDYVSALVLGATQAWTDIGGDGAGPEVFVGFDAFNKGDGTVPFKGVRLLDKYTFSLTIAKDFLPNYNELLSYTSQSPYKTSYLLPPGIDLVDDGQGVHFTKAVTKKNLDEHVKDPEKGILYNYNVNSGPYRFVQFDKVNRAIILEANKYFPGTFDGWKPQIQKIIIKYVSDKTMFDELSKGSVDMLDATGGKRAIDQGKQAVEASNGKLKYLTFDRNGFGHITFFTEPTAGCTSDVAVRQAIEYSLDRPQIMKTYTGGYGSLVYSEYGLGQSEYKKNKAALAKLNQYNFDLNKAKEILVQAGWTLNQDGQPFKEGTDKIRYKKMDGKLVPFILKWGKSDSPVTDLLAATFPKNVETLGGKVETIPVQFPQLIKTLYAKPGTKERELFNVTTLATGFSAVSEPWYDYSPKPEFASHNTSAINDKELQDIAAKMKSVKPGDTKTWNQLWLQLQTRLNYLAVKIPLYSDLYHQFYNTKIEHLTTVSTFEYGRALVYAILKDQK